MLLKIEVNWKFLLILITFNTDVIMYLQKIYN